MKQNGRKKANSATSRVEVKNCCHRHTPRLTRAVLRAAPPPQPALHRHTPNLRCTPPPTTGTLTCVRRHPTCAATKPAHRHPTTPHPNLHTATLTNRSGARLTLFAPPRVTGLPCPALPCRAVASDGPPVTPADCTVLPAPPASVPPRSRLCFVWSAPTWPAAFSLLAFSLCASLVPCDTSSPTPHKATMATDRPAPTLCARRLRDADESDPHFRPRRLCSHLRRARSDQDDQPAAGHAGARWPLHPFLFFLISHWTINPRIQP